MLRRRKKGPPREKAPQSQWAPPSEPAAIRSRRRPKPGAHIPPQLRIPDHVAESLVRPAAKPVSPATPAPRAKTARKATVLVTGFEPFNGEAVNPAWQVCEQLPGEVGGVRLETLRVPCEFRRAIEVVGAAIERLQPSLVICLGQAGGRSQLSVERVAINVDDARIPDNAGQRPIDEPVARDGPPAYFATVPVKAMVAAMRRARVPAEVSNSAGTFVCNHLMYGVLHVLASRGEKARAGFIHVPYAEEQVLDKPGIAALSIETRVRGVTAAIEAAQVHAHKDITASEGRLD